MKNLTILIITIFLNVSLTYGQDWNTIKKVIFYGFTNPSTTDSLPEGQLIDVKLMAKYLNSAKKIWRLFGKRCINILNDRV